ncbi:hypothetical protein AOQ84DRAFT_356028 [Glonium stellatum]|uniref:BIR-domain-containing protein n=1 Tax=Glonium stellatum TaxID=574774 RepID=A0A8E2JQ12_9PEZI|nr:hypothetical protein AOQ84DRAFT_356028 [Glonium stellatum]
MTLSEGVNTLAGRLETFQTAHHLSKRRASSTKKKTPATVSWPHTTPTPEELALAGFYYKPSAANTDNVQCFICQSQLDGWEPGDNPAFEHLTHAPDCGWAINTCIRLRNGDPNRVEDDPLSEKMMEARRATFMDNWPHEDKKGWKCKIQKMVEAGWCYDPSPEYDDGVTCCYCNLSLDGWEPKDNPMDEHRRRAEDCYFFTLVESYAATRKSAPKKKGRQSRTSKASRLSTQSDLTAFSEAPSLMSLGDAPAEADDSVLTTATTATTTSIAGKGRKGRPKAAAKGTRKNTRTKKAAMASESVVVDDSMAPPVADLEVEDEAPPPPKRQTRGKAKQSDALQSDNRSVLESSSPPRKATRTRNTKAKTKARLSEDESQLQSELVDTVTKVSDHASEQGTPKARRGTKRTSDGMVKVDSSVVMLEDPEPIQEAAPKAKRGRKATKRVEEAPQPRSSEVVESSEVVPEPKAKAAPKARKGRKVNNKKEEPVEELVTVEPSLDDFPLPPSSIRRDASPLRSTVPPSSIRGDITPHQSTPKPPSDEPSPAQPSPTPIRSARGVAQQSPATVMRPRPAPPTKESTPSASPQSSDVENQPPSSRPASSRPPLSARHANFIRVASTTPNVSPSKRGQSNTITGGLVSSMPWQAVELEKIFLASPSSAALQRQLFDTGSNSSTEAVLDKENFPQGLSVAEVVKKVKEGLTSPEKKMSVEEWIFFNAKRGEEKLRSECERLVGAFETEGGKALLALEGIESVQ